ncbi:MAG TPA: zinc-ribbon domain-containing protein [Pyrinomonadaceae bacterium]|nr:zinc-ribbon domain-containing protein [Pyrinomonadaceae bacterium]
MQPEISHRCSSCGASVRDRDALFCPECGKPLSEKSTELKADDSVESVSSLPEPEESDPDAAPDSAVDELSPSVQPAIAETFAATGNPKDDEPVAAVHRRGEKTRERLHRASDIARGVTRGVIEEPAKRVEKIRHASNVVIEEASYDPSLRFVLVALGLFVVFVILLVLSKVMG